MKQKTITTALAVALVALTGCATENTSGTIYKASETKREQIVRMGVIESIREVQIQQDNNGIGAIAGGVVGGIAASDIGGGKGSAIAGILGAVAGGAVGNAIEERINTKKGLEITVKLDSGELRVYVQDASEMFKPGERVRLVSTGGVVRVTH